MSGSRKCLIAGSIFAAVLVVFLAGATSAHAQGCVASRMNAPSAPTDPEGIQDPEGNSYYLPDNHWQVSFGYRNYMSHRHFVGSVEQNGKNGTPDRSLNAVVNHVNIPELALAYAINDRISLTADIPFDVLRRRNPPSAATATRPGVPPVYTESNGIGDVTLVGRYWVANPSKSGHQNLSFGLGVKLPTGQDDVDGTFIRVVGNSLQDWVHPVDQSIQPGDGGWGLVTEIQGFKAFGKVAVFASGSYLFNPRGTNGVETGRSSVDEAIMSVADQFAARVGVGMPLTFVKGLSVSLSARLEGVPSSDIFGSSAGFRRPGYSIGIEPGVAYSWKKTSFSFSFPYLVRRVRTQSYADKLASEARGTFVNGDAAFADYIFVAGFSRRF